jgi:hypothetical protein
MNLPWNFAMSLCVSLYLAPTTILISVGRNVAFPLPRPYFIMWSEQLSWSCTAQSLMKSIAWLLRTQVNIASATTSPKRGAAAIFVGYVQLPTY